MARSRAWTAEEYLAELPDDRRSIVETVRSTILEHLAEAVARVTPDDLIAAHEAVHGRR